MHSAAGLVFAAALGLAAYPNAAQEVLRGAASADREPVWQGAAGGDYPLTEAEAKEAALREASSYFSGMIYGWQFDYEVGSAARNRKEIFDWTPLGSIDRPVSDTVASGAAASGVVAPAVTDTRTDGSLVQLWAEYQTNGTEEARRQAWRAGSIRVISAKGEAPLDGKKEAALKEAAREAARSLLRGTERERPKAIRGRIALVKFPIFTISGGFWQAGASFFVEALEIEHYRGY